MTVYIIGADTFTLLYDGSLRMVGVQKNGATIAEFGYDGDGSRSTPAAERRERMVTASVGSVVTSYVGGYFEWQTDASGSAAVKYYSAGSARVAMRKEGVVTYLFGDHLGSTSVTFNDTGNTRQRQGYTAFGEERYPKDDSIFPTDYEYTGQKEFEKIGLHFYNARWYDSALGRFTQADSIIPQPSNPMAWDRFAYSLNNPVKYNDPSGYFSEDQLNNWFCNGEEGCGWRDQFSEYWQKILLKGELGDALAYSWSGENPVFIVFALQDGMLVGWDTSNGISQSIFSLVSQSQDEHMALYRSQNANQNGGATQSNLWPISNFWIENTDPLQANNNGANHYQFVSGWGGGKDAYDLPDKWYQGSQGEFIRTQVYLAGLSSPGSGTIVTTLVGLSAMAIKKESLSIAFGGPIGLATLIIDLGNMSTWDTSYYVTHDYVGPSQPIPTPSK